MMNANLPSSNAIKEYPYPRRLFVRRLIRGVIGAGLFTLTRFKVEGEAHLPQEGPLIVVINHFHFLDAVVMIRALPWPLEFLADFEMPNVPAPLRQIPDWYGTYKVAQGTPNREAIRAAEAVLAQHGVLGVFPEGRLHKPPLHDALPGAAFLALRTGVPVLPVGIYTDRDWDIFGTIRQTGHRLKVTCRFGETVGPFVSPNPMRPHKAELARVGDALMSAIARLLPPEMQGVFGSEMDSKPLA